MSTLRLLCVPHAGASAAAYHRWGPRMPAGVEIVPLELPGHGSRMREAVCDDLDAVVADLRIQATPRQDGPYALFGHSLGALLAFELAREPGVGVDPPRALLVGARNAPATPPMHPPVHGLGHDEFIEALRVFGGTPPAVLANPEILEVFLPALRADLRIAETYQRRPGPGPRCPIAVFAGRGDTLVHPDGLFTWRTETDAAFDLTLLPGRHFLLDDDQFVSAVAARLGRANRRPVPDPVARG